MDIKHLTKDKITMEKFSLTWHSHKYCKIIKNVKIHRYPKIKFAHVHRCNKLTKLYIDIYHSKLQ